MVVGRRSFPFGFRSLFRFYFQNFRGVSFEATIHIIYRVIEKGFAKKHHQPPQKELPQERGSGQVASFHHRNGIYLSQTTSKNNHTQPWAGSQSTTCFQCSMLLISARGRGHTCFFFSFWFQSKNSSALMLEPYCGYKAA